MWLEMDPLKREGWRKQVSSPRFGIRLWEWRANEGNEMIDGMGNGGGSLVVVLFVTSFQKQVRKYSDNSLKGFFYCACNVGTN